MVTSQHLAKISSRFALPIALALLALSAPMVTAAVNYGGEVLTQLKKIQPTGTLATATDANLVIAFNNAVKVSATTKANASYYVAAVLAARTTPATLAPLLVRNGVATAGVSANAAAIAKITAAALSPTTTMTWASTASTSVVTEAFKFPAASANKATFSTSVVNGMADGASIGYFVKAVIGSKLPTGTTTTTYVTNLAVAVKANPVRSAGVIAGGMRTLGTDALRVSLANTVLAKLGATTTNLYNVALFGTPVSATSTSAKAFVTGLVTGLPASLSATAKDPLKTQIAKGALMGTPAYASTLVGAILPTITNTSTALTAFATGAVTANTNSATAGVVANLVGAKLATDDLKAAMAAGVINAMASSAKLSAASTVAAQVAILSTVANKASFAANLAKRTLTYAPQVAVGIVGKYPLVADVSAITTQVMLVTGTNAGLVAGAVTASVDPAFASDVAYKIGQAFTTGGAAGTAMIGSAPAIASAIAKSLAYSNTRSSDLTTLARQIGDVAAILGAMLPANNSSVVLDIAAAIAKIAPRSSFDLPTYYSSVAGFMAEAVQQLGGSDSLIGQIQSTFKTNILGVTDAIKGAIDTAFVAVIGNNSTYTPVSTIGTIVLQETPFSTR
ncbi:MAG: hypothetical protein WCP06_04010 [Verrucomicrobiota bacterium]